MNVSLLKNEALAIQEMTGHRIDRKTLAYLEKARLAYLNKGGEGPLPIAILICAAVETGAMDVAYNENASEREIAVAKKEMIRNGHTSGLAADPAIAPVPATPRPVAQAEAQVGQLINYRNNAGNWMPARYLGPGSDAGTVMIETRETDTPFEIDRKNFDVPDLSTPVSPDGV